MAPFLRKLGIELPIIQAPMAGVSTPEMAAAVSNASGLGSIGVGPVDAETTRLPGFMHANYIITWAWTAAFLLMVIANVMILYVPGLPLWTGLAVAVAARNSAVLFTKWYPKHRLARMAKPAQQALPAS